LQIVAHPSLEGRFFLTEVGVELTQRRRDAGETSGQRSFVVQFLCVPSKQTFRSEPLTMRPIRPGLQTGVVVGQAGSEVHPHESGSVRVQLHWDLEGQKNETSGKWMRVAQRGTADSMLLPRVGWNVFTSNEEGNPDAPLIHSR